MKIKGKKIENVNKREVLIPRTNPEDNLTFTVCAVLDYDAFEKMIPMPQPKKKMVPGGGFIFDMEDQGYKAAITQRDAKRSSWLILKSLDGTEGLEWETVDMSNPDTWNNYASELKSANLTTYEINKIIRAILEVNGLTEDKVEAAKDSFLPQASPAA